MRIIYIFIVALIFFQCTDEDKKNKLPNVIYEYINTEISQKQLDYRIYNPPPPPELYNKDNPSIGLKSDSIISGLKPLVIYINDRIIYDKEFKIKKDTSIEFSFLGKEPFQINKKSIDLDISSVENKKGVKLKSIEDKFFYDNYKSFRQNDNYGGLISFQNLYFSKERDKAYFEINYFKGSLNATLVAVYAVFKNGSWHFKSELISFS
tara:strand:+ start:715 stop:1338 length:624 start_codon:yes stop_codon:yes gene_type:complete